MNRPEVSLVMALLLAGCGNELTSCDQVAQRTGEVLVDALEGEVALTVEAEGHDPDAPISIETLDEVPDYVDVDQLPTEPSRPIPPIPDDADPWDLLVLLGPPEDASERQVEADLLRERADTLDCGPDGWADEPIAEVLRDKYVQLVHPGATYTEFFLIYSLAGVHFHLVGEPIHQR